jgi:hypothetical protein
MKKSLQTLIAKSFLIAIFTLVSQAAFAQTTMFTFPFENNTNPSVDNVAGTPSFLNSIETTFYSTTTPCQGSRMLTQDNWATDDYLQFTVNTRGFGNMSLSFCNRADNTSLGTFLVQVSSDLGDTWTTVLSSFIPTTSNNTLTTGTFPVSANNVSELRIQFLKISNPNNNRDYFLDNVILTGTAAAYPTVATVSSSACVGAAFNITGTNFTGTTAVQVNNTNVTSFVVNSATSITANVAAGNTTGLVKVTNAIDSGTSASSITINALPGAVTLTPPSATICSGSIQSIAGNSGFGASTIAILGSGGSTSTAQTTGSTIGPNPIQNYYGGNKQQMLIRAAELTALGLSANGSRISDIGIFIAYSGTLALQNITVKMQNTALTALSTSVVATNWSTVYTAASYVPVTGVNNFPLTTAFDWNGTDNLLIEINYSNNNAPTSASNAATYDATSYVSTFLYRNDNISTANINGYTTPATATFTYSARNRMQFSFTNVVYPVWTPITGLFTNAAATTAYTTGSQLATVYAKPTTTTTYTATLSNGLCSSTGTSVITVNQLSVAGAVSSNQTICSGTQPANITIATSTGTIQWQSSTDNSVFNNILGQTANTLAGATILNLTATRYYRAVVTSGACSAVNSNVVTVTVNQPSVGGSVSVSTTVCAFSNSGALTLNGNVGNVVKWQSSDVANFSVAVLDIPNTTASLSYLNLSDTTYYRAVIANGVCATAFSSVATITVNNAAAGGTLAGAATVCYRNNSGSLTLSGHSGTIIGWESSLNNFATAGVPDANTTITLNYSNLSVTTYYRAQLSGGSCGSVYSAVGVITVDVSTTWTGAISNSWHNAGNWSCGVVPTSDVNVEINAVTNQPEIKTADAFANSITFDATTALLVTTGNNLRVVNAILGLTDAKLTIESNANVTQENDVDNTIIANVTRTSNPLMRLDYTLWSSPVDDQNLLGFSSATIPTRFYIYNAGTDLYNSVTLSTTNFAEGTGYLIRMPDNHPTTPTTWNGVFEGTLRNGTVNVAVENGTYNAIGNPYPSTINADDFISGNNLTEALYFWRKTNNSTTTSYATYTLAGGVGKQANGVDPLNITPNGIIQVGQGFIAKAASSTLSFTNGMRVGNNNNQFFRPEIERNRIWLNLTNTAGIFSQTMVSYMTGATMGLDAAIDGKYFNDSQLALTSIIENVEYAVQGRALPFENIDIVPLGFKAINAGTYTIGIDHTDGLFADAAQNIFLKDNITNTVHDLRASDYTFASEAGAFNGRFEIVYQMTLATSNPTFDAIQVVVYKQSNNIIINTGKIVMAKVQLFDIRGRLITEKTNINASDATLFAGATNQVILIKITSKEGQVVTKKVVN